MMACFGIHVHEVERTSGKVAVGRNNGRNDPAELHYVVHGVTDNPINKIMLVMGYATDSALWFSQVDYFTAKGYSVLTFDNRGIGRSSDLSYMFSLRVHVMALDALEILDHLGWKSDDTHLAGVSMGGMICLEMLTMQNFRSGSLIVTTGVSAAWMPLGGLWNGLRIVNPLLDSSERESSRMEINFSRNWLESKSTYTFPNTNEQMTNQQWVLINRKKIWDDKDKDGVRPYPTLKNIIGQGIACCLHRMTPEKFNRIKEHGVPLLIVGATEDKVIRTSASIELAEALNPKEFLLVKSGHAVNVQEAKILNQVLERHFDSSLTLK